MTQVELALKEKSNVKNKFGVNLVSSLFGDSRGIKLRVPFGDEMQKQAETLFKGAFSYYRNYCAHDGTKVDSHTSLRVMIIASELLDLIGASTLSFADVRGIEGLVKAGVFPSKNSIVELISILDGFTLPDDDPDWLEMLLDESGNTRNQLDALIDVGLVEYISQDYVAPSDLSDVDETLPSTIGSFHVTELGGKVLADT
jgi:hypothetical protein